MNVNDIKKLLKERLEFSLPAGYLAFVIFIFLYQYFVPRGSLLYDKIPGGGGALGLDFRWSDIFLLNAFFFGRILLAPAYYFILGRDHVGPGEYENPYFILYIFLPLFFFIFGFFLRKTLAFFNTSKKK